MNVKSLKENILIGKTKYFFWSLRYMLTNWKFDYNRQEYLWGFIYYYMNRGKYRKLTYPLIKYRRVFVRNKKNIELGMNVTLAYNCFISPISLKVGDDSWLGVNNFLCGRIEIGKDVHLGPNVNIPGASHDIYTDKPLSRSRSEIKGTIIEDYVWVGGNSTILDGVRIKKGAVIGAGSVVAHDIPEYGIAVGAPAKVIKYRNMID